uniref:Putative secreted protein n=1 Tax=Xenopsylla cheopis TaxID=163159 RepID=A0A6M2DVJ3_XENCH
MHMIQILVLISIALVIKICKAIAISQPFMHQIMVIKLQVQVRIGQQEITNIQMLEITLELLIHYPPKLDIKVKVMHNNMLQIFPKLVLNSIICKCMELQVLDL